MSVTNFACGHLQSLQFKKKKSSNYLNQSAIECTFQWLVLRLLSQQCFPHAKSPEEHVRGSRNREVNSAENLHGVIELPGTLKTSFFRLAMIMLPCNLPGWQWKWQPGSPFSCDWYSDWDFIIQLTSPGFQEVVTGQPLAFPSPKLLWCVMLLQFIYQVLCCIEHFGREIILWLWL